MLRLVLARFAARGPVQVALVAVIALTSGLLAGGDRELRDGVDGGVRALVAAADGTASVRLQTGLADDARAQDDAARRLLARRLAGVEATVTRSVTATLTTAAGRRLVALADEGIAGAARLESGRWPRAGTPGGVVDCAVQADAAAALGLAVGDEVALSDAVRLRVAGTWRATDPASPRWHGEPAPLSGADAGAAGPFVVPEEALALVTGTATVRWVVAPVAERLDERAAAALATAAAPGGLVTAAERAGGIGDGALTADGDLADAASRAVAAVHAGRAAVTAPLLAAGAVALVSVLLLAGMLARTRLDEARALRARGASTPQVAAWSVAEGVLVAAPGAAVGWALGGADPARRGAAVLVGCVAAALVAGGGVTAAVAGGADPRRRGAPAVAAQAALAVALGLGAALAVWQLRLHGPGGSLAAAAPALALLAAVLAVTAAARPVGRLLARRAGRWRGALPALGAVQVARGAATLAVAGVVAALGLGAVGLTALTVGGTQRADREAAERAAADADLRVRLAAPDVVDAVVAPVTAAAVGDLPEVGDALAALTSTVQVGGEDARLVAAPAAELPRVVRGGAVPDGAAGLAVTTGAEPLAGDLRVGVAVAGAAADRAGEVVVAAWLADPQGAPVRVELDPVGVAAAGAGPVAAAGALPPGGPWSLLALDATLAGSPGPGLDVALTTPAGRALPAVALSSLHARDRAPVATAPAALPVLVAADLAAGRGLHPGDALTVALRRGGSVAGVVAGVAARLPAGGALLADLGSFTVAALAAGGPVPAPDELWLATADPAAAAVAVRGALPYRAQVTTVASASTAPVLAPVAAAARRGAAGAAALSVVGLAAAAIALVRARRDEDGVLRALGVRARGVAGLRAGELALAVAGGAVAGGAGGLVAAWACAGPLASAAVPGAPAAALALGPPDGLALAWAGGAALVVLAVALAALRPTGARGVR